MIRRRVWASVAARCDDSPRLGQASRDRLSIHDLGGLLRRGPAAVATDKRPAQEAAVDTSQHKRHRGSRLPQPEMVAWWTVIGPPVFPAGPLDVGAALTVAVSCGFVGARDSSVRWMARPLTGSRELVWGPG